MCLDRATGGRKKCAVMVYCLFLFAMVLHVIGMWQPGIGDVCGHVALMFVCKEEALGTDGHWALGHGAAWGIDVHMEGRGIGH